MLRVFPPGWRPSIEAFIREYAEEYASDIAAGTPPWQTRLKIVWWWMLLLIRFVIGAVWRLLIGSFLRPS
jgi:hypothetical protein